MICHKASEAWGFQQEITVNVNTREVDVPAQSSLSTTQDGTTRLRASTTRGGGKAGATKSGSQQGYGKSNTEPPGLEIWRQERFCQAPRGADQWQVDLLDAGWLVRTHGSKGRCRPFHPLHRSCPLPASQLHGDRITVIFGPMGSHEVLADQWTVQRTWQRPGPWRGYTLLRVNGDASAALAADVAAASEASDGSFECIAEPWKALSGIIYQFAFEMNA